jgi:CRISPR-associated protein Csm4
LKFYEIILQPHSAFGTPLKGDTIFGHFCWQAACDDDLLNGGLAHWIDCYDRQPFAVFSSAWPKFCYEGKWYYALKRPDLPLARLFPESRNDKKQMMEERKEKAAKKWLLVPESLDLALKGARYATDGELTKMILGEMSGENEYAVHADNAETVLKSFTRVHNTINRETMTTGKGMFAPYRQSAFSYYPGTELALFVILDEEATDIDRVQTGLERIGQFGYGRDATTGQGRFGLGEIEERTLRATPGNACYILAPAVPAQGTLKECFFTPFIRYGRHGDLMATSADPFKKPVIMADEGAILVPDKSNLSEKPYVGRSVRNVSRALSETVVQGYAPYLTFELEMWS